MQYSSNFKSLRPERDFSSACSQYSYSLILLRSLNIQTSYSDTRRGEIKSGEEVCFEGQDFSSFQIVEIHWKETLGITTFYNLSSWLESSGDSSSFFD